MAESSPCFPRVWGVGSGTSERRGLQRALANFEYVVILTWLWWCFHGCLHLSKCIKLFPLNIWGLLYVNHTSVKAIFKNGYPGRTCQLTFFSRNIWVLSTPTESKYPVRNLLLSVSQVTRSQLIQGRHGLTLGFPWTLAHYLANITGTKYIHMKWVKNELTN